MWIVVTRSPRPDATVWTGRRGLAAIDALAWPSMWVIVVIHAAMPTGLVGSMSIAIALLSAVVRSHRALWMNERYRFTTWRWGKIAAALLLVGWTLRFAMAG